MTAPLFATPELEAAAGIVFFFSSQAGEFVTGQTVVCDGGGVNAD
jgi:hypothetical protein